MDYYGVVTLDSAKVRPKLTRISA